MLDILTEIYRFIFNSCFSLTGSYGWSLFLMSGVTAVLVEPFKKLTENAQKKEQLHRSILEPKIAAIRNEFSGMERHERIGRLYRKYAYHPLYSLRALFGVLLQVPLLYAAFTMLSTHEAIVGVPFLGIQDLSQPDSLLGSINLLPFVMTFFNLVALAYSQNFSRNDYVQGVIIAAVFLVLLYPAPSALLIYWTVNNAIFAFRSLYARHKHRFAFNLRRIGKGPGEPIAAKIALYYAYIPPVGLIVACLVSSIVLASGGSFLLNKASYWFFAQITMIVVMACLLSGVGSRRSSARNLLLFLLLCLICTFLSASGEFALACWLFILLWFFAHPISSNPAHELLVLLLPWLYALGEQLFLLPSRLFYWPYIVLCCIQLLKYRSQALNSPAKFIDIWSRVFPGKVGGYYIASVTTLGVLLVLFSPCALYASSHLDFGGLTGVGVFTFQAGILVYWMAFFYILWFWMGEGARPWVTLFICLGVFASFLQATVFTSDYGPLDLSQLQFDPYRVRIPFWKDGVTIALAAFSVFACALAGKGKYLRHALWIATLGMGLFCLQVFFMGSSKNADFVRRYPLSQKASNTLLIMIDTFTAEHIRDAFDDEPGLQSAFDNFVWFEDTLANGGCTLLTLPAMLGGRDYAPERMNLRPDHSRREKVIEAFVRLPNQFTNQGARVSMSDPCVWILMPETGEILRNNLTHPEMVSIVNTLDCPDEFVRKFLARTGNDDIREVNRLTMSTFMMAISLFRAAPQMAKLSIYDDADWLHSVDDIMKLRYYNMSKQVAMMANLSEAFDVDEGPTTLNMLFNNMLHRPYLLAADSLKILTTPQLQYYSAHHALRMLRDFLEWMRRNDVFDNTQIIIASDHSGYLEVYPRRITNPELQGYWNSFRPNALLMVKPRGAKNPFRVSSAPMQSSDIYSLLSGTLDATEIDDVTDASRQRCIHQGNWHWSGHPDNVLMTKMFTVTGSQFNPSNWRE